MLVSAITQIVRQEIRRCLSGIARDAAVLMVAGLFAVVALIAALVAAYQALLIVWPPYWAAAAIAGGALAIVLLAFLVLRGGNGGKRSGGKSPGGRPADGARADEIAALIAALKGDTATVARSALDEAEERYRRDPMSALAAAAAAGLMAGLLWPDGPEGEG